MFTAVRFPKWYRLVRVQTMVQQTLTCVLESAHTGHRRSRAYFFGVVQMQISCKYRALITLAEQERHTLRLLLLRSVLQFVAVSCHI